MRVAHGAVPPLHQKLLLCLSLLLVGPVRHRSNLVRGLLLALCVWGIPRAAHSQSVDGHVLVRNSGPVSSITDLLAFDLWNDGTLIPKAGSPYSTLQHGSAAPFAGDSLHIPFGTSFVYTSNGLDDTISGFLLDDDGTMAKMPGTPFAAGCVNSGALESYGTHLFVACMDSDEIASFDIDADVGSLTPVAGSPFAVAGLRPVGLKALSDGYLYVAFFGDGSSPGTMASYAIGLAGELSPAQSYAFASLQPVDLGHPVVNSRVWALGHSGAGSGIVEFYPNNGVFNVTDSRTYPGLEPGDIDGWRHGPGGARSLWVSFYDTSFVRFRQLSIALSLKNEIVLPSSWDGSSPYPVEVEVWNVVHTERAALVDATRNELSVVDDLGLWSGYPKQLPGGSGQSGPFPTGLFVTLYPGSVDPGGSVSPLIVEKAPGGLRASWPPSCAPADTDYALYAGSLGAWGSFNPLTCATGAATYTFAPGGGNEFYLATPLNLLHEGSFGQDSSGQERIPPATACGSQLVAYCP